MGKEKLKVPNLFRRLREDRELSLDDVGKLLGISRQYVFALESGNVRKPIEYANKFAKKLKLSTAEKKELRKALLDDLVVLIEF